MKKYFKLAYGKEVHVNGMSGGGWIFKAGVAYETAKYPPEVVDKAAGTLVAVGNELKIAIEFFDELPGKPAKGKDD